MADLKYYDVILRPVVTEKSLSQMTAKVYTFDVNPEANKSMIKDAVEKMFDGVKVRKVNTMNLPGKTRRRGRTVGVSPKRKKAMVWLTAESKEITLFEGL